MFQIIQNIFFDKTVLNQKLIIKLKVENVQICKKTHHMLLNNQWVKQEIKTQLDINKNGNATYKTYGMQQNQRKVQT